MKKQRKHYTPEEKVAILRRHLLEQVPISKLCDQHVLQPTISYRWQHEFFEKGTAAFQPKARPNHSAEQGADRLSVQESRPRMRSWTLTAPDLLQPPTIFAWDLAGVCRILPLEDRSP